MANNYVQMSVFYPVPADRLKVAVKVAAQAVLDWAGEEDYEMYLDEDGQGLVEILERSPQTILDAAPMILEVHDGSRHTETGFWLSHDESAIPSLAAGVISAIRAKVYRGDNEPFVVEWADTCSKPRIGEFGGGFAIIDPDGTVTWGGAETFVKASKVLASLADTIDATGGVVRDRKGHIVPVADEDWVDLGDVYLQACAALGREPKEASDG